MSENLLRAYLNTKMNMTVVMVAVCISSDCLMLYEPEVANKACHFDLTSMRWHLVVEKCDL